MISGGCLAEPWGLAYLSNLLFLEVAMGSELIIKNISLRGIGTNRRHDLECELENREHTIAMHRARILMLAAATPRVIVTPADEFTNASTVHWEDYVYIELTEALNGIEELSAECYYLPKAVTD
jgi:hypothetical protein